jgi:DNA repair exonuclease SbcCD ATPase subunit
VTLEVVLEQPVSQETRLVEFNDEAVRFFQKATASSPAVRAALAKALELKGALAATQGEIAGETEALKGITEDQSRLRANLERVPPTSEAYKRYLKKFDEQETEIERRQARLKELRETVERQRKAFEDFVQGLNVE